MLYCVEHRQKQLPNTYYKNYSWITIWISAISVYKRQIIRLPNRIEKNRFGSENRIEAFFARIGMLYSTNLERSRHFSVYRSRNVFTILARWRRWQLRAQQNHFFCDETYDRSTSRPCQVRVKVFLVFTSVISVSFISFIFFDNF